MAAYYSDRQAGFIYVMRDADWLLKVGYSKFPKRRMAELKRPVETLYVSQWSDRAESVERMAHRLLILRNLRVGSGEWFRTTLDEAIAALTIAEHLIAGGSWAEMKE